MSFHSISKALVGLTFFACAFASATPFTIDVTGTQSLHSLGNGGNVVMEVNVGANALITTVNFDVNVTAFTPSWLSELSVAFTDSGFNVGVLFTPGFINENAGTASYAGTIDLVALGLSFNVGADGILRLEFYEKLDDSAASPDGIWNSGTLTFITDAIDVPPSGEVPEPTSGLLVGLGLGLIGYIARRRNATQKAA